MKLTRGMLAGLAAAVMLITTANAAFAKRAQCVVNAQGGAQFKGACAFERDGKNGSFSIQPLQSQHILGASIVSVTVVSPGAAEVRGLTAQGINSRWGRATRSTRDPACWLGRDFKICVY